MNNIIRLDVIKLIIIIFSSYNYCAAYTSHENNPNQRNITKDFDIEISKDESIQSLNNRIKIVKRNCFQINWKKKQCIRYRNVNKNSYSSSNLDLLLDELSPAFLNYTAFLIPKTYTLTRKASLYIANKLFNYTPKINKIFDNIISDAKQVIKNNKLNDCRKACLVKCISSNLLKYRGPNYNYFNEIRGSHLKIMKKGYGICRQYSKLALRIGESLKLDVKIMTSPNHSFNKFKINGKWYIGEPQNSRCQFFVNKTIK